MSKDIKFDAGEVFTRISTAKLVIVGDVMLDEFVSGQVERISPEAPVPIMSRTRSSVMPGGAANVARNLCHLGAQVTLIGVTGRDLAASRLKDAIENEPGIQFCAIADAKRPTTVKTRFTAAGQQILRVDDEDTAEIEGGILDRILNASDKAIARADALVLSDYNKGIIHRKVAAALIDMARNAGIPVLVDPKKTDPGIYAGASIITPNLGELRQMTGLPLTSRDEIARASNDLILHHGIGQILTTMGAGGMVLVDGASQPLAVSSMARSVFDVSGAGDTVIATLSAAMAAGTNTRDAIHLANAAAGIVVSKAGTSSVTPGEVLGELASGCDTSITTLLDRIFTWRQNGLKIGFTNGCFDQLHPGHIRVLEKAAASCDRLIVGLNSDSSTKTLKGDGRPFQSEEIRAAVLASLPMVSGVAIFSEKTPARLIRQIMPDRLIKGGDYTQDQVVGADLVRSNGGKVIIVPIREGYSTTRLSQR